MAITDKFGEVSTNQNIAGVVIFAASTNSIALGPNGVNLRDIGPGGQLLFRAHVTEAFLSATNPVLSMSLVVSTEAGLIGGTTLFLQTSTPIVKTDLTLGAEFSVYVSGIPNTVLDVGAGLRYMGIAYGITPGVETFTAGRLTVALSAVTSGYKPRLHAIGYAGP